MKVETSSTVSLLTLVFIVLKLCKVITWSWWWVLAPTWIPLTLAVVFITFCLFMALWTKQL